LRPRAVVGVRVAELVEVAGARVVGDGIESDVTAVQVTGITLRAQSVQPGDIFAALPGTKVHGARFAADAVRDGAVAVLTDTAGAAVLRDATGDQPTGSVPAHQLWNGIPLLVAGDARSVLGAVSSAVYGNPSSRLAIIGVTGTSGKTTTGFLLEAALAAGGHRTGLIGTVQTRIAGQATKSLLTTPEAPELQAMFALMVEQGVDAVAMEVSSHALSLGRVSATEFAVGAFTNLSQDHLDFHPDMESYFQAKAMLFDGRARAEVVDIDDPYGRRLAGLRPAAVTVSAAGAPDAGWSVMTVQATPVGSQRFAVRRPSGAVLTVELALPGHFNVSNAVVALACVEAAGGDVERAAAALSQVVVPGRMERVDAGQDFMVVVDYAHKPAALSAVLQSVCAGLTGRLIVVVGAGGDRDAGKRPLMGRAAADLADQVIVTDDNPRSESPAAIRAAIVRGAAAGGNRQRAGFAEISEIGDRRKAIADAIALAQPGDVVVIAGKGHEQGQDVGGVVHPFSDRAEVLAALASNGYPDPTTRPR